MAGLAVAEGIKARFPHAEICFVSTGNALEDRCLEGRGFKFFKTGARAWKGSISGMTLFLVSFVVSFFRCLWYWRELRPDVVFGLGGYASLVPVLCAYVRRVPVLLLEQNVIPGKATRLLSPWADLILCHWEASGQWLSNQERIRFTGTPLRESAFERLKLQNYPNVTLPEVEDSKAPTLLVLGGSQGARAINSMVMESLPVLRAGIPGLRIIHSTGKEDYARVKESYKGLGWEASVFDFIRDMGTAYASAHLVLSRAGATTLAEITAWGIPAVLVPYPYCTDGHQYRNAEELARNGAAAVVEERKLTAQGLSELLLGILTDGERLKRMREASVDMGKPFATNEIIQCMIELLEGGRRGRVCQSLSPQAL
jgi:UDP-N-acetylglucosamine--N-acetylmuramyl-(pentapeptide) pyrophosphoryl-undecaprenol N-acetylglucosamine transferase